MQSGACISFLVKTPFSNNLFPKVFTQIYFYLNEKNSCFPLNVENLTLVKVRPKKAVERARKGRDIHRKEDKRGDGQRGRKEEEGMCEEERE